MQGLNSQFCVFYLEEVNIKYCEEEIGLGKMLDREVECARERKTKDLLTMEKCSVMTVREVSKRSDEFGKAVRSPAEIQPSGHSLLRGALPGTLELEGIITLILTAFGSDSFPADGLEGRRNPAVCKQHCPEVFEEGKDIQT